MNRRLTVAAAGAPLLVFLAVYTLRAGHGFLLDDYGWVLNSRARSIADVFRLFTGAGGFFRPMVGLTFAVNEWMFGSRALGYGLTNVGLALICAAAIFSLTRAFALPRGTAVLAALLWLMNFHFTNMAIMWISGRTALIVTIFAVLTAIHVLRGRVVLAVVCLGLALLAKEEAVLLPAVLLVWLLVIRRMTGRAPVAILPWILASGATLGLYLVARSFTEAMTPATAPWYYQFQFAPSVVFGNVIEYADRTSTLALACVLACLALLGWGRSAVPKSTPGVDFQNSGLSGNRLPESISIACGVIWLVGSLGFAYVLPVRSDLYAAVPGVGASLAAAAAIGWFWDRSTDVRRRRALVAAVIVPFLLFPVYWVRTQRRARFADFSATILADLDNLTRNLPPGARVVIDDGDANSGARPATISATFGAQLADACELRTNRRLDVTLASDEPLDGRVPPARLRLAVRDGRLQVVDNGK